MVNLKGFFLFLKKSSKNYLLILYFFFLSLIRLDKKCQDECSLLEEIRGYMKKKSEIEAQYHEELNNLSTQYLAKKKPKQEDRLFHFILFIITLCSK